MTTPSLGEPLHIALLLPTLEGGGAERVAINLSRALVARGHKVDILILKDIIAYEIGPADCTRILVLEPDSSTRVNLRKRVSRHLGWWQTMFVKARWLNGAQAVARYLEQERPHCILPHLPDAKIATLLAIQLVGPPIPVVIPVVHSVVMNRRRRIRRLYSRLFPIADRIVTVSDGVADSLTQELGFPRNQTDTIYNAIIGPEIDALASQVPDHPWFVDQGPPIILTAGRLARVKDFPTLLRAFRRLSQERSVRLIILGEGSWRPRILRLAQELNVADNVSLPGWAANPFAYMARSAVFVLSSKYEGLSTVLVEALACGCPCVSTDCPAGSAEILDNGRVGRLVPVGDHQALATAIKHHLDHPSDKKVLLARSKEFTHESSAVRYEHTIRQLVHNRTHCEH